MTWIDCDKPENHAPLPALLIAQESILAVHEAFGAPGNYGYGKPEGDSLQYLYAALWPIDNAIKSIRGTGTPDMLAILKRLIAAYDAIDPNENMPDAINDDGLWADALRAVAAATNP